VKFLKQGTTLIMSTVKLLNRNPRLRLHPTYNKAYHRCLLPSL
jgi:hypothetical protein